MWPWWIAGYRHSVLTIWSWKQSCCTCLNLFGLGWEHFTLLVLKSCLSKAFETVRSGPRPLGDIPLMSDESRLVLEEGIPFAEVVSKGCSFVSSDLPYFFTMSITTHKVIKLGFCGLSLYEDEVVKNNWVLWQLLLSFSTLNCTPKAENVFPYPGFIALVVAGCISFDYLCIYCCFSLASCWCKRACSGCHSLPVDSCSLLCCTLEVR